MRAVWQRVGAIACVVALGLGASACATTENPAEAGFFSGIANIASGTYDRRIDQREQDLARERQDQADLQNRLRVARTERERTQIERQEIERKVARMQGDLAAMRRDLTAARGRAEVDRGKLQAAERELAALEQEQRRLAQNPSLSNAERERQFQAAEEKRRRLRRAMTDALITGTRVD